MRIVAGRDEPTWWQIAREMREDFGATAAQIAESVGKHLSTVESFFSRDATKTAEPDDRLTDAQFIEKHVYRVPRKIDMGPVAEAAIAAVEARRKEREELSRPMSEFEIMFAMAA